MLEAGGQLNKRIGGECVQNISSGYRQALQFGYLHAVIVLSVSTILQPQPTLNSLCGSSLLDAIASVTRRRDVQEYCTAAQFFGLKAIRSVKATHHQQIIQVVMGRE